MVQRCVVSLGRLAQRASELSKKSCSWDFGQWAARAGKRTMQLGLAAASNEAGACLAADRLCARQLGSCALRDLVRSRLPDWHGALAAAIPTAAAPAATPLPADPLGLGVDPERLAVRRGGCCCCVTGRGLYLDACAGGLRRCCGCAAASREEWRVARATAPLRQAGLERWGRLCSGVLRPLPSQPFLIAVHARHSCPACLQWYAEAEKTNGRWAMAAVAGILFTEVLGKAKWFEVGGGRGAGGQGKEQ